MEKKILCWCYSWDTRNYSGGEVIGFKTKKEAEKHAKENYPRDKDPTLYPLIEGEIKEIYTGE